MKLQDRIYEDVCFTILEDLCTDVILETDFQEQHESIVIKYGGDEPSLTFCALAFLATEPPFLFANLTEYCKPIATKSHRHSSEDREFIESETKRLLQEGIIEPSNSPWEAQALVVNNGGKKRMVIDYSQTINRFTLLDACPLPKINELVNKITQY